jgi:hypothetical protein
VLIEKYFLEKVFEFNTKYICIKNPKIYTFLLLKKLKTVDEFSYDKEDNNIPVVVFNVIMAFSVTTDSQLIGPATISHHYGLRAVARILNTILK